MSAPLAPGEIPEEELLPSWAHELCAYCIARGPCGGYRGDQRELACRDALQELTELLHANDPRQPLAEIRSWLIRGGAFRSRPHGGGR